MAQAEEAPEGLVELLAVVLIDSVLERKRARELGDARRWPARKTRLLERGLRFVVAAAEEREVGDRGDSFESMGSVVVGVEGSGSTTIRK